MRPSGRSAAYLGSLCSLAESLVFVVMRQDVEEVQACGICQPWGIKGGRAARPQTAFWFLSSPRLHLFCVLHFTASCLCPFLLFTKRRKPQRGKEGKGWRNLKVFCAPPAARPLIPAVPKAWQSLWPFDAVQCRTKQAGFRSDIVIPPSCTSCQGKRLSVRRGA